MFRIQVLFVLLSTAAALVGAPFRNLGFEDANTNNPVGINTNTSGAYVVGQAEDFLPSWEIAPRFEQWCQTGDIPTDATLINFLGYDAHFELTLDGVDIPLVYNLQSGVPLGTDLQGYATEINDVYGDISAFADKTVQLTLKTLVQNAAEGNAGLDSIHFISFPTNFAISRFGERRLALTWPNSITNAVLESTDSLGPSADWKPVDRSSVTIAGHQLVSTNSGLPAYPYWPGPGPIGPLTNSAAPATFYRLRIAP